MRQAISHEEGARMTVSYVNYYTGNGFVTLLILGDPMDENAIKFLGEGLK